MTAGHLLALIRRESGGDPGVVSKTGFRGLMQIGKATTKTWASAKGILSPWPDVHDPAVNITIGAWNLDWCLDFAQGLNVSGDPWGWAMAVYGWGPGNVRNAVRSVRGKTLLPPSLEDMQRLLPGAGLPHVKPWLRGISFPREAARWNGVSGPAIEAARDAAAGLAALTLVADAGAVLVVASVIAWLWFDK
jgi:hypothetical protein